MNAHCSRPRIAVVGLPSSWSTEALASALERCTGYRHVVDLSRCSLDLAKGTVMHGGVDLCQLDALVVKKLGEAYSQDMLDRLEVLRFVSESGVPVFSKPASVIRLLDRLSCTVTLVRAGIPLPATTVTENLDHAVAAVKAYGEAVLKPLYSTKARGMQLISARAVGDDLKRRLADYQASGNTTLYIQRKVEVPERDLGVMFMSGRYIGTYARVKSEVSWNTTRFAGGHYAPHQPSQEVVELATRAQALFDLELTSVDVVETTDGPLVFEVSAFGGFRGMLEGLGVDLATRYAEHIVRKVTQGEGGCP